jgi:3-carboxy-cis,cis-muconate cycloisomerase
MLAAVPARHFHQAALNRLTDPANALGRAPAMVDRVLERSIGLTAP